VPYGIERREVVTNPHVSLVEDGRAAELRDGLVEFSVLDMIPGQDSVGEGVADCRGGKLRIFVVGSFF